MKSYKGLVLAIPVAIIGIIICLFMIGYFANEHPYGVKKLNFVDSASFSCGLTIESPSKHEHVSFPYTITAYANGCGWDYVANHPMGFVTLLDEGGVIRARVPLYADGTRTTRPYRLSATLDVDPSVLSNYATIIFENTDIGNHKLVQVPITVVH